MSSLARYSASGINQLLEKTAGFYSVLYENIKTRRSLRMFLAFLV